MNARPRSIRSVPVGSLRSPFLIAGPLSGDDLWLLSPWFANDDAASPPRPPGAARHCRLEPSAPATACGVVVQLTVTAVREVDGRNQFPAGVTPRIVPPESIESRSESGTGAPATGGPEAPVEFPNSGSAERFESHVDIRR